MSTPFESSTTDNAPETTPAAALLTSTARVATDRPGRYAKQLAGHFSKNNNTFWDTEAGRGHFAFNNPERRVRGEADLIAEEGILLIHAQADTEENLESIERVIGRHLVMFGHKDNLTIAWQRSNGKAGLSFTLEDAQRMKEEKRRRQEQERQEQERQQREQAE